MRDFWDRHLPPGMNTDREKLAFVTGLVFLTIVYGIYLTDYYSDLSGLFVHNPRRTQELIVDPPVLYFTDYLAWLLLALILAVFLLLSGVLRNRRYFRTPSCSMYLMRRLPQRWEYARRVWTVPVLSALTVLVLAAVGLCILWGAYIHKTPIECLPEQLWQSSGRFLLWL